MPANRYRFVESWTIPHATPDEVWAVLADAQLLPVWWKGVYLAAQPLGERTGLHVGARARVMARDFLPYRLQFVVEATALEPGQPAPSRRSAGSG